MTDREKFNQLKYKARHPDRARECQRESKRRLKKKLQDSGKLDEHRAWKAEYDREYRAKNKEIRAAQRSRANYVNWWKRTLYRIENPRVRPPKKSQEHHKNRNREWVKNNRPLLNSNMRAWHAAQMETNPNYRIMKSLRSRVKMAVTNYKKAAGTAELIGCSLDFLRDHLERQFRDGMTWNNYGKNGWVIDHILPVSSFDLTDPDQQRKCFHYTNLQPLWEKENRAKWDYLPDGTLARKTACPTQADEIVSNV